MAKFDGVPKVYASRETKPYYNFFVDEHHIFPSIADLFHLAAAIGLYQNKRTPIQGKDELLNVYTIDKDDLFETLLESKMQDSTGEQRLLALQEYAETGILYLKSRYDREQTLGVAALLEFAPRETTAN